MEDVKNKYEESKKEVVKQLKAYIETKQQNKEPIPKSYFLIGGIVLIVFVVMLTLLLKKDAKSRDKAADFSYSDYFMQSIKRDVERQKVYSIDDISRAVSGKYSNKEDIVQTKDNKPKVKQIKKEKKERRVVVEKVKEKEKEKARQFVVFVNSSEREKEKGKVLLGITAGTSIDAVVKNEIKGEMPIILYTIADYKKDGEVLIPKGSELFGETRFNNKTERVDIKFTALIIQGKTPLRIRAVALDEKGAQKGLYAEVNRKFEARAVGKSAGAVLGKAARMIPGTGGVGGVVGAGIESVTKEAGDDARDFEKRQDVEFIVRTGEKVKVVFEESF